ncbi:hypothetical protein H6F86_16785 [Phormidium sp. FACHB-592]|uniref:Uncharacterized protein n=1 Tax=Stenomitos frigidus AS-A4 TaxID=2933935 RepID=A0ABV0KUK1_9CYAN|nr:hypothetical protein [Phormidium sp. FACHB-592]MBD2075522.1 hypothetical protein [Phormidium sp. FACHB-592]
MTSSLAEGDDVAATRSQPDLRRTGTVAPGCNLPRRSPNAFQLALTPKEARLC